MTLDEAIQHCDDIIHSSTCKECIQEHSQLKEWLVELKARRSRDSVIMPKISLNFHTTSSSTTTNNDNSFPPINSTTNYIKEVSNL